MGLIKQKLGPDMQTINLRQFLALARLIDAVFQQFPAGAIEHPNKPGLDLRDWWAFRDFTAHVSAMRLDHFQSTHSRDKLACTTLMIGRVGAQNEEQFLAEILQLEQDVIPALAKLGIQVLHHAKVRCHEVAGIRALVQKFPDLIHQECGLVEGDELLLREAFHDQSKESK
jgi:hypothetical protein